MHDPAGAQLRAAGAGGRGARPRRAAGTSPRSRRACASRPSIRSTTGWRASCRSPPRAGGALNVTEAAAALYQRAARRTLISRRGGPGARRRHAAALRALRQSLDQPRAACSRRCCAERGHWLRLRRSTRTRAELCARVNDESRRHHCARSLLRSAVRCCRTHCGTVLQRLPGVRPLGAEPARPRRLEAPRASHPGTRTTGARRSPRAGSGPRLPSPPPARALKDLHRGPARARRRARDAAGSCGSCRRRSWRAQDAAAIAALSRVLARAAARAARRVRPQPQRVDYTYITGAARAALTEGGEPTDLALRTGPDTAGTSWSMSSRTPRSRSSSCSRRSPPAGSRATGARCSWSAIRCSRSTASARPRWDCSSRRAHAGIGTGAR